MPGGILADIWLAFQWAGREFSGFHLSCPVLHVLVSVLHFLLLFFMFCWRLPGLWLMFGLRFNGPVVNFQAWCIDGSFSFLGFSFSFLAIVLYFGADAGRGFG